MPRIIAAMATIPEREESFRKVVSQISKQVDVLYVYANKYDSKPTVKEHNVLIVQHGDIGANGKFFFLGDIWEYYFSIDDDFLYPDDYVEKMIACIEKYERKAVVCVHGSVLPPHPNWYFERVASFPARTESYTSKLVNLPGTATTAFHRSTLKNMSYKRFKGRVRCDLKLAIACLDQKVPIVSIPRKANWLRPIRTNGPDYWSQLLVDDEGRTALAKSKDWSFQPNCLTGVKPEYWNEGSETHLITKERWLKKELYGIQDLKEFMMYDKVNLKSNVKRLERKNEKK